METEIYYIGGSPCSGKTTFARYLAAKTGMYHLELDDLLGKYALLGSQRAGQPVKGNGPARPMKSG